jgi:hypothetical protein
LLEINLTEGLNINVTDEAHTKSFLVANHSDTSIVT